MTDTIKLDCGCEFKIVDKKIIFDPENVPWDCPNVWDLVSEGDTKGIFQLESQLGQMLAKRLKPRNIEHLAALATVIRPGCIAKGTKILTAIYDRKSSGGKYRRIPIEEIYKKNQNNGIGHINNRYLISLDEEKGDLIKNKIVDVYDNGFRDVFKVNLTKYRSKRFRTTNYNLICTDDHLLFTNNGWKMLKDLRKGDRFAILNHKRTQIPRKHISGKSYFGEICYKNYEHKCVFCDWKEASLDVNHLQGNRYTNNDIDNLHFVCPNHHRMYSEGIITEKQARSARSKYVLPQYDDIIWGEYIGKEHQGKTKVYDIEMEAPHHNFIAGNVLVHNCLEAKMIDEDGTSKSITDRYIDRKNGDEIAASFHEALDPILKNNYNLMIYQEDAIRIAKEIAGFSLEEADNLRKAAGKKKPELMAKIKKQFIKGCKKVGSVDAKAADEIFSWIEKSQRYSFNKCLSPSTVVRCNNGIFYTLDTIKIGQYIKTPDGDSEVLNKYNNGVKNLYKITLESGKTIDCTIDHKFMCEDRCVRPLWEILHKINKIVTNKNIGKPNQIKYNAEKITEIKSIGNQATIDIEIDNKSHTFFGNGIATSNSHAVGYAMNSYLSAYAKTHFLKIFYWSYLKYAKQKINPTVEMHQLINNAKRNGVDVKPPYLLNKNVEFDIIDGSIYFGLANIKGIGKSILKKAFTNINKFCKSKNVKLEDISWSQFLIHLAPCINSRAVTNLIEAGALDYMNKSRSEKVYEYNTYEQLTNKEQEWIQLWCSNGDLKDSLGELLKSGTGKGCGIANKNRVEIVKKLVYMLKFPTESLVDGELWKAERETALLSVALTTSHVQACDISMANTTCDDFYNAQETGKPDYRKKNTKGASHFIACYINTIREITTKGGKNPGSKMAFASVSDDTGEISSVVIFPDQWGEFRSLFVEGNSVLLAANKGRQDSCIVQRAYQLNF